MALIDLNNSPRCQHIHFNGRPCKAPARRGRNFCVFHQAAHFDAGGCVLPIIEDVHSYQLAVIRILRALADDIIDSKKATALLYGLQLVGCKLDQFVDQRTRIEDPTTALRDDVEHRYRSERTGKLFFDGIPKADLRRILSDLAAEQSELSDRIPNVPDCREPRASHLAPSIDVIPSEKAEERSESADESRNLHCSRPATAPNGQSDLSLFPSRLEPRASAP